MRPRCSSSTIRRRQALAIVFFDNEDDYRKGDEILERDAHSGHAGQADLGHEVRGRSPRMAA